MASTVSICNQAINLVGGNRIAAIGEGSDESDACQDVYEDLRDFVLEGADWTFATKRYILLPEAGTPDWGYNYQFTKTPEILRVINISDNPDKLNGESNLDWRMEDNLIMTDATKIYIKAVRRVEDPSKFSAGFVQSFVYKIASHLSIPIAGSRSLMADMEALYRQSLPISQSNDGRQGKSDRIQSTRYTSQVR